MLRRPARLIPRPARNWLRSPARSALWLRDELLHAAGRDVTAPIRPDWSVRCHPGAYRVAFSLHVEDPEQVAELDAFIAACRPGMVLLDAGAHFGLFSLAALHYGGPHSRAIAIDPSPLAVRILAAQASINQVTGRLTIVRAALTDREETVELVDAGVVAGGYFVPAGDHPAAERTPTSGVTLDGVVRRAGLTPTHVKIDVEGGEAAVLRGGTRTLSGPLAPVVFVELHNAIVRRAGRDPAEALDLLSGCGYRLRGRGGRPVESSQLLARDLVRVIAEPGARS